MFSSTSTRSPSHAAALTGAVKRFGEVTALDSVDLVLRRGEVTALLGPNGAGKTTAVRSLLGLSALDEGRAEIFGGDPADLSRRIRTGAMMQIASVPPTLTVREHVRLFSSYYPAPLPLDEVLAAAGLDEFADQHYGRLSGGQQQRLLFALAVCGNPELLFLDEPTVGLDVTRRRAFWEHIRTLVSTGRTVLLTTHYLEEADALADRIVVIDRGRIVADGTPDEIKARAAARRVRCRTSLEPPTIAAFADVQRVRRDGSAIEVLTSHAEALVRELLARDAGLTDLEVTGAGLEEAFLSLTASVPELEEGAA